MCFRSSEAAKEKRRELSVIESHIMERKTRTDAGPLDLRKEGRKEERREEERGQLISLVRLHLSRRAGRSSLDLVGTTSLVL